MTITVTLGKLELDAEERRARALRAAELLDGVGWVFGEFVSAYTQTLLGTAPDQAVERERLFCLITAAQELPRHLKSIVDNHKAENTLNERRTRNDQPADHV